MINRITFSVLMLLILAFAACERSASVSNESTFDRIKSEKVIRVGYVVLAPWVEKDPNTGEVSGAYVDIFDRIAADVEWEVDYVETQWSTFAAGVNTGQFDVSIVPSYITTARAASLSFTRPLSYLGNTALVAQGSVFSSVDDLNRPEVTIAVLQGEQGHEYAQINLADANISAFPSGDFSLIYTEVLTGRADAALGDVASINEFMAVHTDAVRNISPNEPYSTLPISWAVRYEDESLREFLNSAINYLDGTGVLGAIHTQYEVPE